jgi:MYXO-CTERM domain-containing protein
VEEGFRRTEGHFANTHGSVRPTPEEVAGFIALIDDDGDFIPFDVTTIVAADGTDVYFVLTPDADLQPGQYAVEPLIVGADRVAFTVGAHTSSDTPQVPEIIERRQHLESGVGNSCGESRGKSFALEHASPFSIAAIGAAPSFDEDKGQWQSAVFTQRRSITVGSVACLDATWDFDDGPTKVSFAAMDLAGTLSDWTEPERVYVEDPDEGWLCAVSPGARESRAMWAALALPLLLAWRRRRSCE